MPLRAMLRATFTGAWRAKFRHFVDDVQFLALRPEQLARLDDLFKQVRHWREWVEERERHERERSAS